MKIGSKAPLISRVTTLPSVRPSKVLLTPPSHAGVHVEQFESVSVNRAVGAHAPTLTKAPTNAYDSKALAHGMFKALSGVDKGVAYSFLSQAQLEPLTKTAAVFADDLLLGLDTLDQDISRSFKEPVPVLLTTSGGGFVLSQGNVFPEGYFRKSRADAMGTAYVLERDPNAPAPTTPQLAEQQPWLRWNSYTRQYTLETSGAQTEWLNTLPAQAPLFRGTRENEVEFIEGLRTLSAPSVTPEQANAAGQTISAHISSHEVSSAQNERLASLLSTDWAAQSESVRKTKVDGLVSLYAEIDAARGHDAVFTAPTESVARRWANPVYLKADFTRDELHALSAERGLYVGYEYDGLEVALCSPKALAMFFSRALVAGRKTEAAPSEGSPGSAGLVISEG